MKAKQVDVLLIEHLDTDAEITLYALHKARSDLNVQRAASAQHALSTLFEDAVERTRLQPSLPRVILLDASMPLMNSAEIYAIIMADPVTAPIPLFMLVGSLMERDWMKGRVAAGTAFIQKPVTADNCRRGPLAAALAQLGDR